MPDTQDAHSVVAIYPTHAAAEAALTLVQMAGIDMRRLSIIGKGWHTEEHALGFYTSGDRMRFWGGRGAFWGSLWGMLFGHALFLLPALGPVVVMGPLVGWMVGVLEGAAVGGTAGLLAGGLASLGIPRESVVRYETEVKAGRFLVLAEGSAALVEHARQVLLTEEASLVTAHAAALAHQRELLPRCSESTRADERRAAKVAARMAHGP